MVEASEIPILWKTTPAVADRLLGDIGRPLLDRLLEHTRQAASELRWPLKSVKVEHYQDPEVDWEYMLVIVDFNCPSDKAEKLYYEDYLMTLVEGLDKELEAQEKDIFLRKIHYDFESNP